MYYHGEIKSERRSNTTAAFFSFSFSFSCSQSAGFFFIEPFFGSHVSLIYRALALIFYPDNGENIPTSIPSSLASLLPFISTPTRPCSTLFLSSKQPSLLPSTLLLSHLPFCFPSIAIPFLSFIVLSLFLSSLLHSHALSFLPVYFLFSSNASAWCVSLFRESSVHFLFVFHTCEYCSI